MRILSTLFCLCFLTACDLEPESPGGTGETGDEPWEAIEDKETPAAVLPSTKDPTQTPEVIPDVDVDVAESKMVESSQGDSDAGDLETETPLPTVDDPTVDDPTVDDPTPKELATACYAACVDSEAFREAAAVCNAMEIGEGGLEDTSRCERDLCLAENTMHHLDEVTQCREACDLWKWIEPTLDESRCDHMREEFYFSCYEKYECKWPRRPGHLSDDSRCEKETEKLYDACINGRPLPEDNSADPDLRDMECQSDCMRRIGQRQFFDFRGCEEEADLCDGDAACACDDTTCRVEVSANYDLAHIECWEGCGFQEGDIDLMTGCDGNCTVEMTVLGCEARCELERVECVGRGNCNTPLPRDCGVEQRTCIDACRE